VIAVTTHNNAECPRDKITVLNIKIRDIDKSKVACLGVRLIRNSVRYHATSIDRNESIMKDTCM
jgi:hypothetical protein